MGFFAQNRLSKQKTGEDLSNPTVLVIQPESVNCGDDSGWNSSFVWIEKTPYPIGSMNDLFAYIWLIFMVYKC